MLISGVQPFTLLDYPDKVAAIIFTPGCNMRCRFCHNKEFVLPQEIVKLRPSFISEKTILNFLRSRKGKLDGLVISGGEPTVQPDLKEFIKKVRALGYLVKLDTNGNLPDVLISLIKEHLVDYVAMDVKTTPQRYKELAGDLANPKNIVKSINLLKKNSVPYEFRTTVIDGVHTEEIVKEMAQLLEGSDKLYLQTFRPEVTLDPAFEKKKPLSQEKMNTFVDIFKKADIKIVDIRQ
ncbi:MAG: anaerobic ribonucleoside-triphosphate reductase activating protein [Parcubacteria group bacterium]|jgi:pyruvate formate lyase activating enzyme